tara:strand:- start:445 stop:948 length:504 start_codon:yes stop_codon:yes gene_type:complete
MGFDLSGVNPKIHTERSEYAFYGDESINIHNVDNEEVRRKYWNEWEKYHDENPGIYFRNNVWYWRPLWNFVIDNCHDFMTEDQMEAGAFNDCKLINQKTAAKIGTKLKILLEDGTVESWEKKIKTLNKKLSDSDNEDDNFKSSYPFEVENVENFANFCLESGGFEIC